MASKKIEINREKRMVDWVATLEIEIERFLGGLPSVLREKFDFSSESLDALAAWLIETYKDENVLFETSPDGYDYRDEQLAGAYKYAAETMRRNLDGSYWAMELRDPQYPDFGVLRLQGPEDNPFSNAMPVFWGVLHWHNTNALTSRLKLRQDSRARLYRGRRRAVRICSLEARDIWLGEVEEAIEFFLRSLPVELTEQLDFSPASLSVLEQWIIGECTESDEIYNNQRPDISDGAARYVGEVFRRHFGGHWEIIVDKPVRHKFRCFPFVKGEKALAYQVCPVIDLATVARDRHGKKLTREFDKIARKSSGVL